MAVRISTAAQNAAANAISDLPDGGAGAGELRIYSGAQPASANDAASGTLLATFTLGDPAFGAASSGTATAAAVADTTGVDDGTAGWFRVVDSDANAVLDGSVTATGGGGDATLNTTTISTGLTVSLTSLTFTMPAA